MIGTTTKQAIQLASCGQYSVYVKRQGELAIIIKDGLINGHIYYNRHLNRMAFLTTIKRP